MVGSRAGGDAAYTAAAGEDWKALDYRRKPDQVADAIKGQRADLDKTVAAAGK